MHLSPRFTVHINSNTVGSTQPLFSQSNPVQALNIVNDIVQLPISLVSYLFIFIFIFFSKSGDILFYEYPQLACAICIHNNFGSKIISEVTVNHKLWLILFF